MYSTCLFCRGALGRNESIEYFPVGRRLAFDSAKGRLWVVCPHCARWNLTPLESRWEAMEEAERAYRDTNLRTATEHIGLAKLREGTELVRIGQPLLPEFAAWRYGTIFRSRYRREAIVAGGLMGAQLINLAAQFTVGAGALVTGTGVAVGIAQFGMLFRMFHRASVSRLAVPTTDQQLLRMSAWDASTSRLTVDNEADGRWSLRLDHRKFEPPGPIRRALGITSTLSADVRSHTVTGDDARRALTLILPTVNHAGETRKQIGGAVDLIQQHHDIPAALTRLPSRSNTPLLSQGPVALGRVPAPIRLALEMSLHETDERRALEGELHALETRWREAEEIAAIADALLTPEALEDRLRQLRTPN